ncbi:hypothetical protein SeMB42_g02702 [Synchytrium endobioticum]|uniref:Uncharacterized protein n=1 Tax=Synchytrium endobioticum TaxID=286115 RepID=A0A507DCE4_9FUNG|nr:hypothetical protein SeMB42_g02702 [Synchytrium endobioticum]
MASVLLNHIKKHPHVIKSLGPIDSIDIASEAGEVVDLLAKGRDYAKKFLDPRSTYVLVKVIGADESGDGEVQYIPLCDQLGDRVKFMLASSRQRKRGHGAPSIASDRTGADRDMPDTLSPNRAQAARNRAKSTRADFPPSNILSSNSSNIGNVASAMPPSASKAVSIGGFAAAGSRDVLTSPPAGGGGLTGPVLTKESTKGPTATKSAAKGAKRDI